MEWSPDFIEQVWDYEYEYGTMSMSMGLCDNGSMTTGTED